jgi:gliding motility-associated-like protein
MKKRCFIIIFLLFCIWIFTAKSQPDCTTDPPLPPVLGLVSVQPESGNTEISWTLSQSPDIVAYIVYLYQSGDGLPIDTIWDPFATSYTYISTVSKYKSASYVVASMRLPRCTSILSNTLRTIFTEAEADTCKKQIIVKWNQYMSYPVNVNDYSILMAVNNGEFKEQAKVSSLDNIYTLNDFTYNDTYYFVIRANLEGGLYSTSNIDSVSTKMQRPPEWINADFATIDENDKISLSFTIDPFSEINRFLLERKEGASGTFQEIARPSSINNSVLYTDAQADNSIINYYRLSAINNCDSAITVSNISSNIVLSSDRPDDNITLSWNHYSQWAGETDNYKLFINTGNGFEERYTVFPSDSSITISYKDIMYEIAGNEVCFYITAHENSNPYLINGLSRSSEICITPTELITVPNIFTPNHDLLNDLFRPVLSFTPDDYQLIITNRQGTSLFETRDFTASWDGYQNGNAHPQGVYLWFLKVTTPSGKTIIRTGTITIIND